MPRKPKNLTASEAQGLRRVRDRGPTAWAASVHNRSGGAVSRMFERLADKGLCTRAPHTITEKGIEALRVYDAIGDREAKMSKAERLFAWVTQYPDGTVGTVGAFVPELGTMTPLVSRDRDVIERLRPLAVAHAKRAGQRVWLREYRDFVDHGDA